MNLARSSLKIFGGQGSSAILVFLGLTFFARHLDPAQMGVFFLFETLVGVFALFSDFGLRGAVEKRMSEGHDRATVLTTAILLKLLLFGVVGAGIYLGRGAISTYTGADLAGVVIIGVLLNEGGKLLLAALRGELRVGDTAILEVGRNLAWVGIGAVLVAFEFGTAGVIVGFLCGLLVLTVWAYQRLSIQFGAPSLAQARSLVVYSRYNFISAVGGYIYNWMDVLMLGFFLSNVFIGAYEYAWRVTILSTLLARAVAMSVFPQFSNWSGRGQSHRIESLMPSVISLGLLISLPAFFGALVFADPILRYVFGPEYAIAKTVLILLMAEKVFLSVKEFFDRALLGLDHPELVAKAVVFTGVLNLVLNLVLIPTIGFVGAAVATAVAFAVETLLLARYLSRFISIHIPYRQVGWYLVASLLMTGAIQLFKLTLGVSNLIELVFGVGIGVCTYGCVILLVPETRDEVVLPGLRALM